MMTPEIKAMQEQEDAAMAAQGAGAASAGLPPVTQTYHIARLERGGLHVKSL
jgi:hypothetical protein